MEKFIEIAYKKNTIMTKNCNFPGKKSYEPWVQTPLNLSGKSEKYIDGFEKTGDLSRKREKPLECHRPEFISMMGNDLWSQTLQASTSWRTNRNDGIFGVNEDFDEPSRNLKKIAYKKTIIETGSIDHSMPFVHSNK